MDRAGNLIARLKIPGSGLPQEDLARAAWARAVGKVIARHSRAVSLAGSCLRVEVEDAVWRGQLVTLEPQILAKLREVLGPDTVARIEFRVRIPRRPPQSAERLQPSQDEADRIADPVFRHIYKSSRKRSLA